MRELSADKGDFRSREETRGRTGVGIGSEVGATSMAGRGPFGKLGCADKDVGVRLSVASTGASYPCTSEACAVGEALAQT